MQQKLSAIENAKYKVLELFLNSNSKQIIIPEQLENSEEFYTSIFETISLKGEKDPQKLSRLIVDFVDIFLTKIKEEYIGIEHFDIPDMDRKKVQIIEKVLTDNLFTAFPGIENMVKEIGFSESKLKILFKLMYRNTLFQYYREKQLMLSKLMLESDDKKVNEIAFLFGYENVGKFSIAFKNQFGVLPSQL